MTELKQILTAVELLASKVDHLASKVDSLDARIGHLETKVDSLDARMGRLETKVDALETKVSSLDARLGHLEIKVGSLEHLIIDVKGSLEREMHGGFQQIYDRFDSQSIRLDRHAALLQTGSRWTTRMTRWSERIRHRSRTQGS